MTPAHFCGAWEGSLLNEEKHGLKYEAGQWFYQGAAISVCPYCRERLPTAIDMPAEGNA
jgi:hypothetical protein